jgi:aminoglycoside 6-adenylyltransferase
MSPPADDYSDLDLILFSLDPSLYTATSAWLHELGELWIATLNYIGPGDPEWLALFEGGIKADLLFVAAESDRLPAQMLAALPYQDVLARGVRVIYSGASEHQESSFPSASVSKTDLPSEQIFEATVNNALFAAERFAKFVRRGDFWRSQTVAIADLRRHMLILIEWHAQFHAEMKLDTWYDGRFMEKWADARVLDSLRDLDFGSDSVDKHSALSKALKLIEWLATETAARLGYAFPTPGQSKAFAWLNDMSPHDSR